MNVRLPLGNLALIVAASLTCTAYGATQTLNLDLLPTTSTTNRLNIQVSSSGFSDSDLTRTTGSVRAAIDYGIVSGMPVINAIEFTGGQVSLAGSTSPDIELSLGVPFIAGVDITGTGLGGTLDTPSPPSSVSDGLFNTAEHEIVINSGTLVADGYGIGFSDVNETYDFQMDSLPLTTDGTASIELMEISATGSTKTYEVTLMLPVNASETIEGDVSVDINVSGTIVAGDAFTITFPLEGDYNGDAIVNAADYTVWRDSLGATGDGLPADGNFDRVVDHEDYEMWANSFGESPAGAALAATSSVPEPTSLALGTATLVLLGTIWRLRDAG